MKGPLPETQFACDVMDFSFGMDKLEDLRAGSYTTPSATRWAMIPACLQCCLNLEWRQVGDAWVTLLMVAGARVHQSRPSSSVGCARGAPSCGRWSNGPLLFFA